MLFTSSLRFIISAHLEKYTFNWTRNRSSPNDWAPAAEMALRRGKVRCSYPIKASSEMLSCASGEMSWNCFFEKAIFLFLKAGRSVREKANPSNRNLCFSLLIMLLPQNVEGGVYAMSYVVAHWIWLRSAEKLHSPDQQPQPQNMRNIWESIQSFCFL